VGAVREALQVFFEVGAGLVGATRLPQHGAGFVAQALALGA
jgi:hypothetical protein